MQYDRLLFLISTLAVLIAGTAAAQPVAATINAAHAGPPIARLISGGFMEPATTGVCAEMLFDRKFYSEITSKAATAPPGMSATQAGLYPGRFAGPPAKMAESSLLQAPDRITLPPAGISVYEFAVKHRDCEMCPEMVVIPPGTFIMGSPETEKGRDKDEGQHTVTIAYSFAVSKGPITWDQWEACVRDAMCDGQAVETALRLDREGKPIQDYVGHSRGNHPVVGVSWWDAQAFINWLNKKIGKEKYRLLSESEFEYAARAGTTTAYWWGNEPSHDYANYGKESGQDLGGMAAGRDLWKDSTSPICSFPTNAFGLCDMHGNIYQWIEDCYEADSSLLPTDGSAVKEGNCAVRGFRSNSFESNAKTMRSANRAFVYAPDTRGRNYLGFRVAKTLQ